MWNKITDNPKKKTSALIAEARKLFPVYFYDEENADRNFPAPEKKTTRTFEASQEAPEKHKNKSFDDLQKEGVVGISVREYLILAMQYFRETGSHLDVDNWTLCSGSQDADGHVPHGHWHPGAGKLYIRWCSRDDRYGLLRTRQVVGESGTLAPSAPSSLDGSEVEIGGKRYKLKAI